MRVVQFSTGLASAEVARREVDQHGPGGVHLLTADTRAEDPDNWRFAHQVVDSLGPVPWTIVADGRTPMQVGRDNRIVPNDRMDICSKVLKRQLLRRHIDATFDPTTDVIVLGFDWTEPHRAQRATERWAPWQVACPLADDPSTDKADLLAQWSARGIEPPRLYAAGFPHANCGGACVRAGQASWALLLRTDRATYLRWEAEETETRVMLGRDVSILKDRRGGTTRPLSLAAFRERIDGQPRQLGFDADDWGACNCMGDG